MMWAGGEPGGELGMGDVGKVEVGIGDKEVVELELEVGIEGDGGRREEEGGFARAMAQKGQDGFVGEGEGFEGGIGAF